MSDEKYAVNSDGSYGITSIDALKDYASNAIVRFPDFDEGKPFVAEVKRISMLLLAKSGKIPNSLLTAANELFSGVQKKQREIDTNALGEMYDIVRLMAEACLVKPSMQELDDAGIQLTDEQLIAIFNYTQKGVKALTPFREKPKDSEYSGNEQSIQTAS